MLNWDDYNESEKYFLKYLEYYPNDCDVNASYGYLLYLMGKYEDALEQIQIGLEMNEKSVVTDSFKEQALSVIKDNS